MPVDHLSTGRHQFLSRSIFAESAFVVFFLNRQISGGHMIVGTLKPYESTKRNEWLRTVVDAQIKDAIFPGLSGWFARYYDESRRLPAANIAARVLGRVECCQHAFGEVAFGIFKRSRHGR